jgi:hypothetical protein
MYQVIAETDARLWAQMPNAADMKFLVLKSPALYADTDGYRIRVSEGKNGHLVSIAASVAHEMAHILLRIRGHADWDAHGDKFNRIARRICKRCGFDPKGF